MALLVKHGVDPTTRVADSLGRSPLYLAAIGGHINVVNFLLQKQNAVIPQDMGLRQHQEHRQGAEVPCPARSSANLRTSDGSTLQHIAVRWGFGEVVKALLDAGADISATSSTAQTPSHLAASLGHSYITQILLDHGAYDSVADVADAVAGDHDNLEPTPLYLASSYNHLETVGILLTGKTDKCYRKADISNSLFRAIGLGYVEVVELLVREEVDIDIRDMIGRTPLHIAAHFGWKDIVDLLLNKGADSSQKDCYGRSALYWLQINKRLHSFAQVPSAGDWRKF